MTYLDLDTILSEEERVPCVFQFEVAYLGFLNPNDNEDSESLPKSSKVELPVWLATSLANTNVVTIEAPKHFGTKMRDEIRAGAESINLKEFSYYFFEVGLKLCRVNQDSSLLGALRIAFSGDRFKNLLVHCMSMMFEDSTEFAQALTSTELKIFNIGN